MQHNARVADGDLGLAAATMTKRGTVFKLTAMFAVVISEQV